MENNIELNPSDEIIKKAEESEKNSDAQFMTPKVKPEKKGRGRPPKDKGPEKGSDDKKSEEKKEFPKIEIPSKIICLPITKGISALGVSYTNDPRAALTPSEAEEMAEAFGMILDKYMPDIGSKYGPELMLSLSLGQYGLRLYAIKKIKEEQLKKNIVNQQARPQGEPVNTSGLELSNQGVDGII